MSHTENTPFQLTIVTLDKTEHFVAEPLPTPNVHSLNNPQPHLDPLTRTACFDGVWITL